MMKRGNARITLWAAAAAMVLGSLTACGSGADGPGMAATTLSPGGTIGQPAAAVYPVKQYATDSERWEAERQMRQAVDEAFYNDLTDFAYATASRLLKDGQTNEVYSPLSLYYALALSAAGAGEETGKQMRELLGAESQEELDEDARNAFEALYRDDGDYKFQMADSLWIADGLSVKDTYLASARENYFADVFQGDFQTEPMKEAMENWVREHTGGLIEPEIRTENARTLLYLMNTVYYYVEWQDQFSRENTKEDVFTTSDGRQVNCEFMNQRAGQDFYRGGNYTAASLYTKSGSMQILLPDEGVDIRTFLESPDTLREALEMEGKDCPYGEVTWKVPKFSYGSRYDLKGMLLSLGVTDAFSPESADFSGMTDTQVWIDTAIQMAHIGINEDGVEAAAFTYLAYEGAGMPADSAEMILDRPFLYVIRDNYCGNVPVFIGVCEDPTAGENEAG